MFSNKIRRDKIILNIYIVLLEKKTYNLIKDILGTKLMRHVL